MIKELIFLLFISWTFIGQSQDQSALTSSLNIIPAPNEIHFSDELSDIRVLKIYKSEEFTDYMKDLVKHMPQVSFTDNPKEAQLIFSRDFLLKDGGYSLNIDKNQIVISASDDTGMQYGFVSLMQLIHFHGLPLKRMKLRDLSVFGYRGMHLDVARHFFSIDEVKKYLDFMAFYKMNRFHWHLTDDQGWRVEIKKYPKLQEIAAYRKETLIGHYNDIPHKFDGQRYGGYYTQDEIREVVKYASDRNITIIPEIDIPGHSQAALSAYPELGCEDKVYEAATLWGVFEDVLCPNEVTFQFLNDVFDELMDLFPGEYIHIGGDECPKVAWKNSAFCQQLIVENNLGDEEGLQSYIIKRVAQHIQSKGRKIIGWDEILEGGLAQDAIVMSWRGVEGGIEAARQNHNVIMTPVSHCYFDYYQSESPDEPLSIGGYIPIEKVYHWNPIPKELTPDERRHILGGQSNLWTEYIHDFSGVEYMAYARDLALSEALWSQNKNYRDFTERFQIHYDYWTAKGVNMAFHIYELKPLIVAGMGENIKLYFDVPENVNISWTHGKNPAKSMGTRDTLQILKSGLYNFKSAGRGKFTNILNLDFDLHKATKAKITLDQEPSDRYAGHGSGSLVNGIIGPDNKYSGNEWLGFSGTDCNGVLEFNQVEIFKEVTFRFFKGEGQWIYLPKSVTISISSDNRHFEKIASTTKINTETKIAEVKLNLKGKKAKFLRFDIENYGIIADGNQGAGHRAWLFVDEITVK